jgi:hypothetical protein
LKPRRRDADNGEDPIVDPQRSADRRRIAAQPRLPVVVGHDEHRLTARSDDLVVAKQPAERRAQAKHAEVVARDEQSVGALDTPGLADAERRHPIRNRIGDGCQPLAQVRVLAPGHARIRAGVGTRLNEVDRARVGNAGQRPEDYRLHPRKHRSVDANPHRQRHHHHARYDRHVQQRATGVAEVQEHGHGQFQVTSR